MEDEISYKYSDLKKAREIAKQHAGLDAKQAEEQIAKLQKEIGELEEKFARATSQAQITRAGYVYVISNIVYQRSGYEERFRDWVRPLQKLKHAHQIGKVRLHLRVLYRDQEAPIFGSSQFAKHLHRSSRY